MIKSKEVLFLLLITITLVSISIIMVYSSSSIFASQRFNDPFYFLKRQIIWVFIGIALMLVCSRINYKVWQRYSFPLIICGIVLLILVFLPWIGKEIRGARRQLLIGQPVEFVKLALVIYIAAFLSKKQEIIKDFIKGFLPFLVILSTVFILTVLQPSLGGAINMSIFSLVMFLIGGGRILHLGYLFLFSLPLPYILIWNVPYRKRRILGYLFPFDDPLDKGYQIIQSFSALRRGALHGVGIGNSTQKLFYLPEPHTDFIFSIIGEEMGFIGAVFILLLFLGFAILGIRIACKAPDLFANFLGVGIISMIITQVILNISVVTGLLPTTGLPLPFISFGGSSLISNMIAVGILLNISRMDDRLPKVKFMPR
ncbi:MAG: putative lipid II flippase FtsW [bacterium]|nr:putative lipid II flippase FtsW [bacterium]